jgi:ABC-2 type transport system ATP-binding protein
VAVVAVRGLTKSYGRRPPALQDVTLEFGEGVTGLLGPNGAGKSTLMQCVLGLLPDWTGEVTVLGLDARRDRREIRRRVGFMPEVDAYLPNMTGIRAVRYLGMLTGMRYAEALRRAHEVLFHVGLGEAIYRDVVEYSTGMRQRFKLAQAVVHDPELIFLDEPTSGMDPEGRDDLLRLILDLARTHRKHVVWSSHILPEVQRAADSIVVLQAGRCRGTFRLEDLRARHGAFAVDVEGDAAAFQALLSSRGIPLRPPEHAHAATPGPDGSTRSSWIAELPEGEGAPALLRLAKDAGVRVRRVEPLREDLEVVFHRILDAPGSR